MSGLFHIQHIVLYQLYTILRMPFFLLWYIICDIVVSIDETKQNSVLPIYRLFASLKMKAKKEKNAPIKTTE